jgi:nitrite reductase/ring-hydroxylating ferredoxin subunit
VARDANPSADDHPLENDDTDMTWRFRRPPAAARPAVFATGGAADKVGANEAGPRWVDVGGLADLRDNRLVADLNGTSVLVVRAGRALAAVENECPHLGQQLSDGQVSGRVIRCAAHGYRWDLATGQSVQGRLRVQRRRPLREVPIRLVGDRIMLGWSATRTGPADPGPREAEL